MERIEEENIVQVTEIRNDSEESSDSVIVKSQHSFSSSQTVARVKEKPIKIKSGESTLSGVLDGLENKVLEEGTSQSTENVIVSANNQQQKVSKQRKRSKNKSTASSVSGYSDKSEDGGLTFGTDRSDDDMLTVGTSHSSDIIESSKNSQDSLYKGLRIKREDLGLNSKGMPLSGILEGLEDDIHEVKMSDNNDAEADEQDNVMEFNVSERAFIQNKKGFESTSNDKLFERKTNTFTIEEDQDKKRIETPHDFALYLQKNTRNIFDFCHGVLAGFGICHISLIFSISENPDAIISFAESYPDFARLVQILYYILSAICLISALDRCDLAGLTIHDWGNVFRQKFANVIIIIFYLALLIVTVIAVRWDDRIALSPYNNDLWKDQTESQKEFNQWRIMSLLRGLFAVIGYAAMFCGPNDDMFYDNLVKMKKYDESGRSSQDLLKC